MADIITDIGSILTGVVGWFGDVFTMITSNDLFMLLILIPIAVSLVYFVVRIIKSFRTRKI